MEPSLRRAAFVRRQTRLQAVPAVPEVRLHVADDLLAVWQRAQDAAGDDAPLPFWAAAWPGGIGLARHVLDHPGIVAGRTVWDVATGSGLVAIAAARAGAAVVVASDVDPDALVAAAHNATANGVTLTTVCADAFAADGPDAIGLRAAGAAGRGADPPVVLVGDAFYDAAVAARARAFVGAIAAGGGHVLIGDPGRRHLPVADLVPLATYTVSGMAALEASPVVRAGVWTPRRAPAPPGGPHTGGGPQTGGGDPGTDRRARATRARD